MIELDRALAGHWGLAGAEVRPHHGGMNSATWFVAQGQRRYVAKAVTGSVITPGDPGKWFRGGLAVADALAGKGFRSGAPVRTAGGRLSVPFLAGELALLDWVDGTPLDRSDQDTIGTTLARVHHLLRDVTVPDTVGMDWIDPDAAHLGLRPWLRGAVAAALEDLAAAGPLAEGLLHADPAPEAFRGDGLIDWGVALHGPLLYDVASAVMYLGGPAHAGPLLKAYQAGADIEALPAMLRFRFAVQADYFARRLAAGDLTGIDSGEDNERGLQDAWRGLEQVHHRPRR